MTAWNGVSYVSLCLHNSSLRAYLNAEAAIHAYFPVNSSATEFVVMIEGRALKSIKAKITLDTLIGDGYPSALFHFFRVCDETGVPGNDNGDSPFRPFHVFACLLHGACHVLDTIGVHDLDEINTTTCYNSLKGYRSSHAPVGPDTQRRCGLHTGHGRCEVIEDY